MANPYYVRICVRLNNESYLSRVSLPLAAIMSIRLVKLKFILQKYVPMSDYSYFRIRAKRLNGFLWYFDHCNDQVPDCTRLEAMDIVTETFSLSWKRTPFATIPGWKSIETSKDHEKVRNFWLNSIGQQGELKRSFWYEFNDTNTIFVRLVDRFSLYSAWDLA